MLAGRPFPVQRNASEGGRESPATVRVAGIVALAIFLRLLFLGKENLTGDEAWSVYIARFDWPDIWATLKSGEANMGLYYVLLHLWLSLGQSEFVLRAFSVLFAAITVPVCYLFGAQMFGPRTGLLAALLLALNAFHIRYAQEARSYALVALLATLASWCFVSGIRRPAWKTWAGYVGTVVAGVYSHAFAALILPAHWLSLVFLRPRQVPWRFVLTATCIIGALLLPFGAFALTAYSGRITGTTGSIAWTARPTPDAVPRALVVMTGAARVSEETVFPDRLFKLAEVGRRILLLCYAGLFAVVLVHAARRWVSERTGFEAWMYAFLITWLLAPPILLYLLSLLKPLFVPKYLIISLPALVFLAADGLSRIRPPRLFAGVLVLLVGLTILQASAYYASAKKEDWRGVTEYILTRAQPGDGLVFYKLCPRCFEYYRDQLHRAPSSPPAILELSDPQRDRYRRLWLVLSLHTILDTDAPAERVRESVAIAHQLIEQQEFAGPIRVLLYGTGH